MNQLSNLRLEFWNGVRWERSNLEVHNIMNREEWEKLKPQIKRWTTPWRIIGEMVIDQSEQQPK